MQQLRVLFLSWSYQWIRLVVLGVIFLFQRIFFLTKDLEVAINFGDRLSEILMDSPTRKFVFYFSHHASLSREFCNMMFASPLTFASFKGHIPTVRSWLDLGAGGGCFKTILSEQSHGNPRPRIVQCQKGGGAHFINALGLPGKGCFDFVNQLKSFPFQQYNVPLGLSIGGEDLPGYLSAFNRLLPFVESHKSQIYFELNLSCPNTSTGLALGQQLNQIETLLNEIRFKTDRPISVKVSPSFENRYLCEIADLLTSFESIFLNCGNTLPVCLPFENISKQAIYVGRGGLSGPSLFPRTMEMIGLLKSFRIPLMATGGVSSVANVKLALESGAGLVGMATALVPDPYLIPRVNRSLL